jgi:phosphatidylglycerol:prolipoprotein diacylglycerol transferase
VNLPFLEVPPFVKIVGPLRMPPFGMLVATGVIVGSILAVRRTVKRGLDRAKIESMVTYTLLCSFLFAHVLDVVMYRPRSVLEEPLELLFINRGISSFGGFVGCAVGALVWRLLKKEPILPYGDQIAAVFPLAWIFGRAGCSLAHDHIGRLTTNTWLGVPFPENGPFPPGLRFDLGLLELFATIPIAVITLWFARRPRPAGRICGLICVLYAPVRFVLDGLRGTDFAGADARYFSFTPGQWLSIALLALGVGLFAQARGKPPVGADPNAPPSSRKVSAGVTA